jgi:hypothetical protein
MFNCDVHQSLSVINSAAVSLKIINTRLTVFLKMEDSRIFEVVSVRKRSDGKHTIRFPKIQGIGGIFCIYLLKAPLEDSENDLPHQIIVDYCT